MVMYPPGRDTRFGGEDSELARVAKREIIAAFDKMLTAPLPQELNGLWEVVATGEKALGKELKRIIGEHGSKNEA
jgi:hypothetical protein